MWPFSYRKHTIYSQIDVQGKSFDYVVVGGGTGGCVLASRLSEDSNVNVLLLERGPVVDSWFSRVPLLSVDFRSPRSPTYQWTSALNVIAKGVGATNMISGKTLGGTSKVNAFVYTRSVPGEYNAWSSNGREGWSWTKVEPYFKKSELSLNNSPATHRGDKGPWRTRQLPKVYFRHTAEILKASESLGIPCQKDIHDPAVPPYTCGLFDVTIDENGCRHSTFDAFLPPEVTSRPNLFVCTESVVSRLDLKEGAEGIRVAGVFLEPSAQGLAGATSQSYISATKEVIMCAGAIATPQILMLSGLGPRSHLEELGIPVVKDLPGIGTNLQDHSYVPLAYKIPREDSLHELEHNPLRIAWELMRFIVAGQGWLLSPNPQMAVFALSKLLDEESQTSSGLESGRNSHSPDNIPDIELTACPFNMCPDITLDKSEGALTMACILLKPKSAGTVRLASLSPYDRPICDLNCLREPEDYEVFRKAIRLGLAVGRKCREQGYPVRDMLVPDSEDDEDLDRFIRARIGSTYHYTSTCRMAPEEEMGVVDDELRVYGVRNLRIADASIFPAVPSAHPQAPVVMVAERCTDFVNASRR